ncbi:hypothetical protein TNCV_116191 [Trichonephila clavipes]|nr:hypothetical protein TNCV_116191 [Trichonephila clavipes]
MTFALLRDMETYGGDDSASFLAFWSAVSLLGIHTWPGTHCKATFKPDGISSAILIWHSMALSVGVLLLKAKIEALQSMKKTIFAEATPATCNCVVASQTAKISPSVCSC